MRAGTMALLLFGAGLCAAAPGRAASGFTAASPEIGGGRPMAPAQAFDRNGCGGGNRSPALSWSEAPPGTRSFAVALFDVDAPGGRGWWHWAAFDIPASAHGLPAGAGSGRGLPAGARQRRNDFGLTGYAGPCPPPGTPPHHYVLTVHALRTARLPVAADAPDEAVAAALRAETLATASLTGTYGR